MSLTGVNKVKKEKIKDTPKNTRVDMIGFWLPCGNANFFKNKNDNVLLTDLKNPKQKTFDISKLDLSVQPKNSNDPDQPLNSSVYRRLVTVLRSKGYDYVIPITPPNRGYSHDSDPHLMILMDSTNGKPQHWPNTEIFPKHLILILNNEGFYLWLAVYENIIEGEHEKKNEGDGKLREDLKEYVAEMLGGDYFSHYSGRENDIAKDYVSEEEKSINLTTYRDNKLGILNFFQLNIILEGIFSSTFDPEVFFWEDSEPEKIQETKKEYSLRNFSSLICTDVFSFKDSVENNKKVNFVARLVKKRLNELFNNLNAKTKNEDRIYRIARTLTRKCLNDSIKVEILRQFLRNTAAAQLHTVKWNIESSRRVLLNEMIGVIHRRQPLLQLETSDTRADSITNANESQLRGYIMLISAKFPIVLNIQRYLRSAFSEIDPAQSINIKSLYQNWNAIVDAISENIKGIEYAIEQAHRDRLLYEQEQIRYEQEAMAESERIRERGEKTNVEITSSTVGLVANFLTVVFILVTVWGIDRGKMPNFNNPFQICLLVIQYFLAYIVFHYIIGKFVYYIQLFRKNILRQGYKYFYEMNVRIDAPIEIEKIREILDINLSRSLRRKGKTIPFFRELSQSIFPFISRWGNRFIKAVKTFVEMWWRIITKGEDGDLKLLEEPYIERNSYRNERLSDDEALHKIHLEVDFFWSKSWKKWPFFTIKNRMKTFITYELLFHRPSDSHSYILRELRLVSTFDQILEKEQLKKLETRIIDEFINKYLKKEFGMKPDINEPLLTLFYEKN